MHIRKKEMFAYCSELMGWNWHDIMSRDRSQWIHTKRKVIATVLSEHTLLSSADIGRMIGRTHATILSMLKSHLTASEKRDVARLVDILKEKLANGDIRTDVPFKWDEQNSGDATVDTEEYTPSTESAMTYDSAGMKVEVSGLKNPVVLYKMTRQWVEKYKDELTDEQLEYYETYRPRYEEYINAIRAKGLTYQQKRNIGLKYGFLKSKLNERLPREMWVKTIDDIPIGKYKKYEPYLTEEEKDRYNYELKKAQANGTLDEYELAQTGDTVITKQDWEDFLHKKHIEKPIEIKDTGNLNRKLAYFHAKRIYELRHPKK